MNQKLEDIPLKELLADKIETVEDIALCLSALATGITHYSGGTIQKRLDSNYRILDTINGLISRKQGGPNVYKHPIILHERRQGGSHTGIADLGTRGDDGKMDVDKMFSLQQGDTSGYTVFEGLDAYMERLKGSEKLRVALGIPCMSYHAYGFPYKGYNVEHVSMEPCWSTWEHWEGI